MKSLCQGMALLVFFLFACLFFPDLANADLGAEISSLSSIPDKAQKEERVESQSKILNVAFCDLLRNPDFYDGKDVRFRATFVSSSMHLVSTFYDKACNDKNYLTWAEFDESSVKASSKPDVIRKLEKEVLLPETNFVTSETELLVTGVFHKPNKTGYGRDYKYRFMITVNSIERIGDTKRF